jgi:hypothetical protein
MTAGHDFERDEDGDIDLWAHTHGNGWHNGPRCTRCGAEFCHHCHPERMTEQCPAPAGEKP